MRGIGGVCKNEKKLKPHQLFPARKEKGLDRIQTAKRILQRVIVDDRLKQCGRICREQQMQLRRMDVPDRITKFFQQREIRKELALPVFGQVVQKVLIFCSVGLCQEQMIVLHTGIHKLAHHVNPRVLPQGLPAVLGRIHVAGSMLSQPCVQPFGCRSDQLVEQVGRLRAAGFKIEMDDFGSGYSSLNMLKDLLQRTVSLFRTRILIRL